MPRQWSCLPSSQLLPINVTGSAMLYLLFTLWPWIAAALALGFLVGWLACSPRDDHA